MLSGIQLIVLLFLIRSSLTAVILTYGFTGFAIWKINKDAGNSPAESEA